MSNETAAQSQSPIVIERTYRASIEDVWSLWTTKEGFESWWGPQGFRVEVHALEAHEGGPLHYDMIADTPEMVAAMKEAGQPVSHPTRSHFAALKHHERLVVTSVIDFLPGVEPYESSFSVDFTVTGDTVRMVVTLNPMHSADVSGMQKEGFESQLGKLEQRFA